MSTTPAKKGKGGRLNARQLAFVRHLVSGKTNADAYLAAGYRSKDQDTAFGGASKLLRNDKVKAALRLAWDEAAAKQAVTAEMVIGRLWLEARGLGPDTTAAARVAALDKLARKLGLYAADRGAEGDGAALILRLLAAKPLDPPARAGEGQAGS